MNNIKPKICTLCNTLLINTNVGSHIKQCKSKIKFENLIKNMNWNEIQIKYNNKEQINRKILSYGLKNNFLEKRKIDDETKQKISNGRKKWLSENPDKHPWKNNNKFKSIPCEFFKNKLIENNIKFEYEVNVSKEKNYSVDVLIKEKNLVIEINGNQHYNKNGELSEYYLNRHNFIKNLGFNIIEIPYYKVYDFNYCLNLINTFNDESIILPFYKKGKIKKIKIDKVKIDKVKKYNIKNEEEKIKKIEEKNKKINEELKKVDIIINSNINFLKFGWVNEASIILNILPQKVNIWMKLYMYEFWKEKCFKRKGTKI